MLLTGFLATLDTPIIVHKDYVNVASLPCVFVFLDNGIDTKQEKEILKKLGLTEDSS
jgi:hypothetical protein